MTSTSTRPSPRRRWPLGGHDPAALASATIHLLLALPIATAVFVLTVSLGALALGLLPLYPAALAAFVAWLGVVHGAAALERARVRALLGVDVPAPTAPPAPPRWHARLWAAVRHRSTWRAVAYHLVRLPLSIVSLVVVTIAVSLPLSLLAIPLTLLGGPLSAEPVWTLGVMLGAPLLGLVVLPLSADAIDAAAAFEASVADSLLGVSDSDRRDERIERLSATRSELVDIAEQERRRIERDLHDGAGQQLVSLAMTLGMAKEKLRDDPTGAQQLIDEAHAEAKHALVGLREIVRGISPAILSDRGLGAALSAVAARSAIPVALHVDVPQRPDAVTEGIAYYLVCEGIGNALRHADATTIRVSAVRRGEVVEVEVADDGRGGADPSRGTGLRGLAGRVAAVDGDLHVTSPHGGPTVIRASLPIREADSSGSVDTATSTDS